MSRAGHTLAELLAALPLAGLLLATLLAAFVAQARLARGLGERIGRNETERLTVGVLAQELRWTAPGDLAVAAADSLALRLLRGSGPSCGPTGETVIVEWRGLREPNPDKDSVLVVGSGGERRARLLASTPLSSPCTGAPARQLRLTEPLPRGMFFVYENAVYCIADRALRFRAGAEGRQPLTEEWLDHQATQLVRSSPGTAPRGIVVALRGGLARQWSWALPNHVGE